MAEPKKKETEVPGTEKPCVVKYRTPPVCPVDAFPEEPPEGRPPEQRPHAKPPYSTMVVELLQAMVDKLQTLVKAAEIELIDLKLDSGIKTLTTAVATQPQVDDIRAAGYTQELIYPIFERLSPELYFINLGPGTIFARSSKDGSNFTLESPIFEGEVKTFYDVYELRLRSPTANTGYLFTEFEYFKQKDISFLSGRPYVSETTVAVAGVPNTENIVTDAVQGLGRNAHTGYIIGDGPGNLLVELSNDGVTFAPAITVIPNQILDLTEEDIHTIRIDASVNATAYRLAVH